MHDERSPVWACASLVSPSGEIGFRESMWPSVAHEFGGHIGVGLGGIAPSTCACRTPTITSRSTTRTWSLPWTGLHSSSSAHSSRRTGLAGRSMLSIQSKFAPPPLPADSLTHRHLERSKLWISGFLSRHMLCEVFISPLTSKGRLARQLSVTSQIHLGGGGGPICIISCKLMAPT